MRVQPTNTILNSKEQLSLKLTNKGKSIGK